MKLSCGGGGFSGLVYLFQVYLLDEFSLLSLTRRPGLSRFRNGIARTHRPHCIYLISTSSSTSLIMIQDHEGKF